MKALFCQMDQWKFTPIDTNNTDRALEAIFRVKQQVMLRHWSRLTAVVKGNKYNTPLYLQTNSAIIALLVVLLGQVSLQIC